MVVVGGEEAPITAFLLAVAGRGEERRGEGEGEGYQGVLAAAAC